MKIISSILLILASMALQAQDLESVELKASDLVSGNAENDLIALAESAKIARKPVVVMAPDSWRQQIASLLRKAWPQIKIRLKKSPSGKMKAWLLQPEQKANPKALAPEIQLPEEKPEADFNVKPVAETNIHSVAAISQNTLTTPGLVPLGKPLPANRATQVASGTKLRSRPHESAKGSGPASKAESGSQMASQPDPRNDNKADKESHSSRKPIRTRSRKFVSQSSSTKTADQAPSVPQVAKETNTKATAGAGIEDPVSTERKKLERIYNKGKSVKKKLTLRKLKLHDVLYVWEHNTLVMRRSSATKRHFWLEDWQKLDLDQPALKKEDAHLYRVRGMLNLPD